MVSSVVQYMPGTALTRFILRMDGPPKWRGDIRISNVLVRGVPPLVWSPRDTSIKGFGAYLGAPVVPRSPVYGHADAEWARACLSIVLSGDMAC